MYGKKKVFFDLAKKKTVSTRTTYEICVITLFCCSCKCFCFSFLLFAYFVFLFMCFACPLLSAAPFVVALDALNKKVGDAIKISGACRNRIGSQQ